MSVVTATSFPPSSRLVGLPLEACFHVESGEHNDDVFVVTMRWTTFEYPSSGGRSGRDISENARRGVPYQPKGKV